MRSSFLAALLLASSTLLGADVKIVGSAGAEFQSTPANASSLLNPSNVLGLASQSAVADATTFVDVTPQSLKWKLHFKLRGEANDEGDSSLEVGEAYLRYAISDSVDITAGRIIEKWGSGYGWNPTAFISPRKNPTDPNDRRSTRRGLDMVRADVFAGGTNLSLYALEDGSYAGRAYRLLGNTDVSLYAYRDDDGASNHGISVAHVFGDALEIHGEIARRRALLGLQYTFGWRNMNVVAELYRSGDGMSERDFDRFVDQTLAADEKRELMTANRSYAALQMGRNYSLVRFAIPQQELGADIELLAVTNLRDASSIVRVELRRSLRSNLTAYLSDTEFVGGNRSEIGMMQVKRSTTVGMRVSF